MPVTGPVRLVKSDGQFTPKNLISRAKSAIVGRDNFTAGTCLSPGSLDRPNVRNMSCNIGQCPGGYTSYGYEDGTTWNYGSACNMRNMICVKNNYNTSDWKVVADCCNGLTAQKDCDSTLCRNSQGCRDKMRTMCDTANAFGIAECQTWLNAGENMDMKQEIMPKYCTAEMMGSGACRAFASSAANYGLVDAAVTKWCTPGQIANPQPISSKLAEVTRWRMQGGPTPAWYQADWQNAYITPWPWITIGGNPTLGGISWTQYDQYWQLDMINAVKIYGLDNVVNPKTTYRDNSKDPLCACLLSPLNKYGDKAAPPSCFDTSCVAGGYQTGGMKIVSSKCPSWVECRSNIAASSGGTNDKINVQQICGGPPIVDPVLVPPPAPAPTPVRPTSTPVTQPLPVPPVDDKDKLLADEARGNAGTAGPNIPILPVLVTPSIAEQLGKPFAPNLFGSTSIASVAILFFAIVIISAILWRTWMNRKSTAMVKRLQEEQTQREQMSAQFRGPQTPESGTVRSEVQAQLSQMPRMTASPQ